jgi:GntR family transcriptional regulator/MocR family aminotransferase
MMQVPILLDRRARVPLHRQIYDRWREGILSGRFAAGTRVPSTRDLAAMLSVARATVTTAYDQLTAEGYLESAHGSGTFVSRALPDQPATRIRVAADPEHPPRVRLSRFAARLEAAYSRPDPDHATATIDLSKHSPDVDQFPLRAWRRLILRHVKAIASPGWDAADRGAGHEGLRREIAAYVRRARAVRCEPSQVVVVNGSQQALDLCARVLIDAGDVAAIEDPCYPGARQLFAAHGARLHPVPVERDGIAVSRLPERARLVFVTPSHQLPTGVSMSLAKRLALLAWARERGVVVIEDDYDSEYRYGGEPVPALQGLSDAASVVYVGTFSNVMFPGLRIGYLVAPPALVEPITSARWHADRRSAVLEQAALADFLREGHFERHVRRMRRLYGRRRDVLTSALTEVLGDEVSISCDGVGMFVVVRFSSERVAARARRQGVRLNSTARYYLGEAPPHEYVLRFSGVGERTLREGVRRLAAVR